MAITSRMMAIKKSVDISNLFHNRALEVAGKMRYSGFVHSSIFYFLANFAQGVGKGVLLFLSSILALENELSILVDVRNIVLKLEYLLLKKKKKIFLFGIKLIQLFFCSNQLFSLAVEFLDDGLVKSIIF